MASQATKELNRLNFIRNFYREKFSNERRKISIMSPITQESYKEKIDELTKSYDEVMAAIALIDEDLSRYV